MYKEPYYPEIQEVFKKEDKNKYTCYCRCDLPIDYDMFICTNPECMKIIERNLPDDEEIRSLIYAYYVKAQRHGGPFVQFILIVLYLLMIVSILLHAYNNFFEMRFYFKDAPFFGFANMEYSYAFSVLFLGLYLILYCKFYERIHLWKKLSIFLNHFFITYVIKYIIIITFIYKIFINGFIKKYKYNVMVSYLKYTPYGDMGLNRIDMINKWFAERGERDLNLTIFRIEIWFAVFIIALFIKDMGLFIVSKRVEKANEKIAEKLRQKSELKHEI